MVGLVGSFGLGCLWDRDTLAAELKGMPEMQDVIAGRFERNPDLYYEMRLERIRQKADKEFPGDYFDVAVALDRLGRHDEAISEIEKELDSMMARVLMTPESYRDLEYKRFANLGTFYIHRGLKKGDKGLADLKKGLGMIEQAVEVNPEAHFGREKVQAALVRQMIWQQELDSKIKKLEEEGKKDEAEELRWEDLPATGLSVKEIREGVIGLMVLGQAWESTVAWHWLLGTLGIHDGNLASLIEKRINELDKEFLTAHREDLPDPLLPFHAGVSQPERVTKVYFDLRANGEEWAKHREEFMTERLKAGKHPDMDDEFWNGYDEVPEILVKDSWWDSVRVWLSQPGSQILLVSGGAMGLAIVVFVWKRVRRGK